MVAAGSGEEVVFRFLLLRDAVALAGSSSGWVAFEERDPVRNESVSYLNWTSNNLEPVKQQQGSLA